MIVQRGTRTTSLIRHLLLNNWPLVALVVGLEIWAADAARWLQLQQTRVFSTEAVSMLATVVGIFLVFRFNEAYGRWWEARILWGALVNRSRDLTRQIVTQLTAERLQLDSDAACALQKQMVFRHLAFVHALRSTLRREPVETALTPFLSLTEQQQLQGAANVPAQLLTMQSAALTQALTNGLQAELTLSRLDINISALYDIQGGCERIKNTVFPDTVTLVSKVLVWGLILLLAVTLLEPDNGFYWLEVVGVTFLSLSFLAVQQLGADLKNPFEGKANDTPMSALSRTIEIDLRQMLGETELPPPLEAKKGVLM